MLLHLRKCSWENPSPECWNNTDAMQSTAEHRFPDIRVFYIGTHFYLWRLDYNNNTINGKTFSVDGHAFLLEDMILTISSNVTSIYYFLSLHFL